MISHIIQFENNSQELIKLGEVNNPITELDIAISKLRYGGKLIFHGIDYKELARLTFLGAITETAFNDLVRGKKLSCIENIINIAESKGLVTIEKYFDNYHYHLTFERKLNNVGN